MNKNLFADLPILKYIQSYSNGGINVILELS